MPTIEEVGSTLKGKPGGVGHCTQYGTKPGFLVPTNVKDRDTFHITTEEYLHGLISLIEELVSVVIQSCPGRADRFPRRGWLSTR